MDILIMVFMWLQGYVTAYILWAPMTTFKRGFIDGLTFKFIWGRK